MKNTPDPHPGSPSFKKIMSHEVPSAGDKSQNWRTAQAKAVGSQFDSTITAQTSYCICSTDGRKISRLIFSDEDRIEWKNRAAIIALCCGIDIIVYSIMTNHVHFLVRGSKSRCALFMSLIIREMVKYYQRKEIHLEGKIEKGVSPICDDNHLRNAIAYTLRNHLTGGDYAGMFRSTNLRTCLEPSGEVAPPEGSRLISELSVRQRRELLRSRKPIPKGWRILQNGELWDGSITDYNAVRTIFGSMAFFLTTLGMSKNISEMDVIVTESFGTTSGNQSLTDNELRAEMEEMSYAGFGERDLKKIPMDRLCFIAANANRRHGTSAKRLSRILHINEHYLRAFIRASAKNDIPNDE